MFKVLRFATGTYRTPALSRAFIAAPITPTLNITPLPYIAPPAPITKRIIKEEKHADPLELPNSAIIDALITPALRRLDINDNNEIFDPRPKQDPLSCASFYKKLLEKTKPKKKFAMTILHIRHRKMKKHQLRKFRRRVVTQLKKRREKRNIRKEKAFRAEILAKIKEAEQFNAEEYVKNMLETIDKAPSPPDKREELREVLRLIRLHRSDHCYPPPEFKDPVPKYNIEDIRLDKTK